MERIEHPLEPVFRQDSRVLILGTMPSPKSRETGFYYGHPRNRFFPILAEVFGEPLPVSVEERKAFVLRHGIALWDVLASCWIDGASDASIRDPVPNDLSVVLDRSGIRTIYTTGAKAYQLYRKYCEDKTGLQAVPLPSPSPANAAMSFSELVRSYSVIRKSAI